MKGIMADINIQGQVETLHLVWLSPDWRDFWQNPGVSYRTFADFGLQPEAPDSLIWQVCQDHELCLITGNRNEDSPDSLEATLKSRNTPHSLPVFTVADIHRFDREPSYVFRTAMRLLDYFLDIDRVRGAGRLYVP